MRSKKKGLILSWRPRARACSLTLLGLLAMGFSPAAVESRLSAAELYIAPFQTTITPPIGDPLQGGNSPPVSSIKTPLYAKGIVLKDAGGVYVLCAMDLCWICGDTYDQIRAAMATAAGTTPSRVELHSVHQHTANMLNMPAQQLAAPYSEINTITTQGYVNTVTNNTVAAIQSSLQHFQPVTQIGTSQAQVQQVASTRRCVQPDGSIVTRLSSTTDPALKAMPEGYIDPYLKTISFYNGQTPLAQLHFYASHPQSYYNDGRVDYDVPGIAREQLQQETGVEQIYFNGAGGDIAMGKYNTGAPQDQLTLAARVYTAMQQSVNNVSLQPAAAIDFRTTQVQLGINTTGTVASAASAQQTLQNSSASSSSRIQAAQILAWDNRVQSGKTEDVSCISIGSVKILNLPGEAFVNYQLTAQEYAPNSFVATAAYGDCAMGYIPTNKAYTDNGGFEQHGAYGAPSEAIMKSAIETVLTVPEPSQAKLVFPVVVGAVLLGWARRIHTRLVHQRSSESVPSSLS